MSPNGARLTAEHIAHYQRDGAVLIKAALGSEDVATLQAGVEEAYLSSGDKVTKVRSPTGEGETLVREYAALESPSLQGLIASGVVGEIGAGLMQTKQAQLVLDQIFYKTRGPIVPTPWHQDTPFLRVRGDQLVRLWFPCDFSPKQLTVQVVRGSHRWNVVYNAGGGQEETTLMVSGDRRDANVGDHWLPPAPDVRRYRESFDILSWDVEPGDVLAFQGNMLHGTDGVPMHNSARRAFAVLLGGPELRYHKPSGRAFPSPGRVRGACTDSDIPDGAPIGEHVDAFPVCWPVLPRAARTSGT